MGERVKKGMSRNAIHFSVASFMGCRLKPWFDTLRNGDAVYFYKEDKSLPLNRFLHV